MSEQRVCNVTMKGEQIEFAFPFGYKELSNGKVPFRAYDIHDDAYWGSFPEKYTDEEGNYVGRQAERDAPFSLIWKRPKRIEIVKAFNLLLEHCNPATYNYRFESNTPYIAQIMGDNLALENRQRLAVPYIYQALQYPLMEHQIEEVSKAALCTGRCNFSATGTGKTVMIIATMFNKWLLEGRPDRPCLIVCPNHIRLAWKREFDTFTNHNVKCTIVMGTPAQRKYILFNALGQPLQDVPVEYATTGETGTKPMRVIIAGYDTVTNDILDFMIGDWFAGCLDEAHRIKTPLTNRTEAIFNLQRRIKHRYVATGTPDTNSFADAYTPIEWVFPNYFGKRWHEDITEHSETRSTARTEKERKRDKEKATLRNALNKYPGQPSGRTDGIPIKPYINDSENNLGVKWSSLNGGQERLISEFGTTDSFGKAKKLYRHKEQEFQDLIKYASCRYLLTDIRDDMPDQIMEVVPIDLTEEQKVVYKALQEKLLYAMESAEGMKTVTITNMLTQYLRLVQVTGGWVQYDEESGWDFENGTLIESVTTREDFVDNPKLDKAIELCQEAIVDNKCIIWAHFRHDIDLIMSRLASLGIKHARIDGRDTDKNRQEVIHAFNNDSTMRVLVANPGACGEGLNLQGVQGTEAKDYDDAVLCNTLIFYSTSWSSKDFIQAMARPYRLNTTCTQYIYSLQARASIDNYIYSVVQGKCDASRELLGDVLKQSVGTT